MLKRICDVCGKDMPANVEVKTNIFESPTLAESLEVEG